MKDKETNFNRTQTKPQETLEFKTQNPSETFCCNIPSELEGDWIRGLTTFIVFDSTYNLPSEQNKPN